MQAVILAAGEGVRMRPLTHSRPKAMLPVAGKPVLEHLLVEAAGAGIRDFVFIVGYKDEQILNYFGGGEKWGVRIFYRLQQKAMGTADALRMARGLVRDKFLVMNADAITSIEDITRLIKCSEITIAVKEVNDVTGLGLVEVTRDRVLHIYEKPDFALAKLANTGIYLLTEQVFSTIAQTPESPRGEYELTQSLEMLIRQGVKVFYQPLDCWLNVSYPWDLLSANESLLAALAASNEGTVEENVVIRGTCAIGQGTRVRSGSYIIGPVVIGRNCDIGPGCYIRPSTAIGDDCRIGAAVEVKNSIIMRGSQLAHQNYVGDSIIGERCNLGAGTKIANLRLDKKEVIVNGVNTRRQKLGAILGDGVETGINASIDVGTIIGGDTVVGPGALAGGFIAAGSRVFRSFEASSNRRSDAG